MTNVRAKKHLGQHFLHDQNIAKKIAQSLTGFGDYKHALEIGPGTGALTRFLLEEEGFKTSVIEIDTESIDYLKVHYPELQKRIIEHDFLKVDLSQHMTTPFAVIGNFPYNISSQILFKVYDNRNAIPEVVGMFQKEVAERVAEPPGSKRYGILSVLIQAFYDIEYLFTVSEKVFTPPPKVKSGVIRLTRNSTQQLGCNEDLFKQVVKTGFNHRRKTLRNSLKSLTENVDTSLPIFNQRPEQLSVEEFVGLTKLIES
jgi:16S rRNA (adenine1518-N6/adenine1519-N6)-dimethyltransferase